MPESSQGLWDLTLRRVKRVWPGSQRGALKDRVSHDLSDDDVDHLRHQIDACLEGHGGEVSARARAAELGETYLVLSAAGRRRFLQILASDYGVDESGVEQGIAQWHASTTEAQRQAATTRLQSLLRPPRVKLLAQVNAASTGVVVVSISGP